MPPSPAERHSLLRTKSLAPLHLLSEEPLVRGHAAWALGRIGITERLAGLHRQLQIEEDDHVKLEIEEAIGEAEKSCPVVPG
jgi:hypothetical protein